jgi:hypothetical protein
LVVDEIVAVWLKWCNYNYYLWERKCLDTIFKHILKTRICVLWTGIRTVLDKFCPKIFPYFYIFDQNWAWLFFFTIWQRVVAAFCTLMVLWMGADPKI